MPKVKVMVIQGAGYSDYDDLHKYIVDQYTDWEERTHSEILELEEWVNTANNNRYRLNNHLGCFVLVRPEAPLELKTTIEAIQELDNKHLREYQARLDADKKKREDAKAARELKKRAKTEAEEKRLLEDLQKKYGS